MNDNRRDGLLTAIVALLFGIMAILGVIGGHIYDILAILKH